MKMKKSFVAIILALFIITAFSFTACNNGTEQQYTVSYIATDGGYINGETSQTVKKGRNAATVTAIPNTGYVFAKWSDNRITPKRTDMNIKSNLDITAIFKKITQKTFNYVYNEATGNNTTKNIKLKLENLQQTLFVVPEREAFIFQGWYLDWLFKEQVSDELGNIVIGDEIFATDSTQLFAKWVAVNRATYKILMVYVTEINAKLETIDGIFVDIDFKMTETEKQVCEMISLMFGQYLNALLNGLVNFEIDTLFTTEPLDSRNFESGITNPLGSTQLVRDYSIFGYNIPEIGGASLDNGSLPPLEEIEQNGILGNYRSIITTFGMNDYEGLLHVTGGTAGMKYASIHIESILGGLVINEQPVEWLLDFNLPGISAGWVNIMELYLHEFTHTLEQRVEILELNGIDFHNVLKYYGEAGSLTGGIGFGDGWISEIEVIRLFLLYQVVINERTVGIPNSFWFVE